MIRYTSGFLTWLKQETIENQSDFTISVLYEIYVNSIVWKEIPDDPEIPANELTLRL